MKALILSDGRPGHVNQAIALVTLMGLEYDICPVNYKNRFLKLLSYIFDALYIRCSRLFHCNVPSETYSFIVAAGSTTAYPLKVLAKQLGVSSIAMMLPRGYRYDYDIIFAQRHDQPPSGANIVEVPANFSFVSPQGLYRASKKALAVVIGGDNAVFRFDTALLRRQLDGIFDAHADYELAVTTSPRTGKDIEGLLKEYPFDYRIIYSENPVNPIPDFLYQCERVFITQDSTSMISEAIANGQAYVEVLPLVAKNSDNKFVQFVLNLEKEGYLHLYDGSIGQAKRKIDFKAYIRRAGLPG